MVDALKKKLTLKQEWFIFGATAIAAIVFSFVSANTPWFFAAAGLIFLIATFFIFRNPWWGMALVGFLLPLERIGAYEAGGSTIRLSQVFLAVTAVAWFFQLLVQRKYAFVKNPLLILLGLFLVINLFSVSGSLNVGRSATILVFISFTSLLAVLVPNLVTSSDIVKKVVVVLVISFVLVAAFGLFQFLGDMLGFPTAITGLRGLYTKDVLGFTRVQSTAYEPLYFANYLLIPLSLLFALFLSGKVFLKSIWLILLFGVGVVDLVLTVSRGGYLALAGAVLVIVLFYFRRVFTVRNIIILAVAVIAVGWIVVKTFGVGNGVLTLEKVQEHIGNAFYGASYNERVETISQAITAWREHPWLGVGVGDFGPYVAPHPYYMPKDGWRIVNNEFIEILAETGILGLFSFCLFILFLVLRSVKAILRARDPYLRAILVGLLGAFAGIIIQYQTFSTLYVMHIWFLIGLMIAVQNIIFSNLKTQNQS